MIHRIDRYILKELLTHDNLPFSELRPPGVESNTLTYRLKRLISEGIVAKDAKGQYYLTGHGQLYTDQLNLGKFIAREFPKPLNMLVIRRPGNEWLLYERHIHPLKGLVGLPTGHVEAGVPIVERAARRVKERRGLEVTFVYRGGGYLSFYKGNELQGSSQFNLLENIGPVKGDLRASSEEGFGKYFWVKDPDFTEPQYIPSLKEYQKYLEAGKFPFFAELSYRL